MLTFIHIRFIALSSRLTVAVCYRMKPDINKHCVTPKMISIDCIIVITGLILMHLPADVHLQPFRQQFAVLFIKQEISMMPEILAISE